MINRHQYPRTLLINPSIDSSWDRMRTGETNIRRPSLGLQYIMAVLRSNGYPFQYRDHIAQNVTWDNLLEEVDDETYDIVGIHSNVFTKNGIRHFISALKEKSSIKILIGGPGSIEGQLYMDSGADVVLNGEAENRLIPLMKALFGNGLLENIQGIWYRSTDGEICQTPPAPFIKDLDSLPFPLRLKELIPLYGEPVNPAQKGIYISIISSRGCPFHCTFCLSHELWGHKVRTRSVDNVLAEIEAVLHEWPRAYFTFVDDVFGLNSHWVEEFCRKKLTRKLHFNWTCILHPMSFQRERNILIPLMSAAGCNCISFGAQSSSPLILDNIRRHVEEPQELASMLNLCKKNNILSIFTFIFGLPGENEKTINETIDWTLNKRPHLVDFHPLFVLPHSAIDQDLSDSNTRLLSQEIIEKACAKAFRSYYFNFSVIVQLLSFIIRKNPGYLLRLLYPMRRLLLQMRTHTRI